MKGSQTEFRRSRNIESANNGQNLRFVTADCSKVSTNTQTKAKTVAVKVTQKESNVTKGKPQKELYNYEYSISKGNPGDGVGTTSPKFDADDEGVENFRK